MKCPKCQAEVAENAAFCSQCGEKISGATFDFSSDSELASDSVSSTASEKFAKATASRDSVEEETLWEGTYAGKAMLGSYLVGGLITVVMLVSAVYFNFGAVLWWIAFGIFLAVWAYITYQYAKNRFGVRYRLTSHRFFHETGILLHKTDLIEVIDIDDITYTRTIIDRLTGVGTIKIDSSDRSHPQLSLPGIADVEEVARLFQDTRHEERRRRAVHIESI